MRLLIYIFGLLSLSSLSSAKDKSKNESGNEVADKEFLRRYKLILQLYDHINQLSFHKEISETANKFDLEQFLNDFKKPDVAEKFRLVHEGGHLSRNAIFSEFHNEHIAEAKALFFLFYFSNTLETFFEAACWARQNLNGRLFLYSLGAALTHREDCKNFSIPPIYEVTPEFFFNSETIQKAQDYKIKHYKGESQYPKDDDGFVGYTISSNYSGDDPNLHPDQAHLSYYLEDIGINAFFYYYYLYYPYWLSGHDLGHSDVFYKRGEVFFYHSINSAARFYLERLANKLGDIPDIYWDSRFLTGFVPSLRYPHGMAFPSRPDFADLKKVLSGKRTYLFDKRILNLIKDYSRRLRDAIDEGVVKMVKYFSIWLCLG